MSPRAIAAWAACRLLFSWTTSEWSIKARESPSATAAWRPPVVTWIVNVTVTVLWLPSWSVAVIVTVCWPAPRVSVEIVSVTVPFASTASAVESSVAVTDFTPSTSESLILSVIVWPNP